MSVVEEVKPPVEEFAREDGPEPMDVDVDPAVAAVEAREEVSPRRPPPQQQPECPIHHLKTVDWHDVRVKIVTQNENGPCPLVAICNVLLLNGKLKLTKDSDVVYSSELVDMVGNLILESYPEDLQRPDKLDLQQNINDAIAVLPKLMTGLDVNVKFTGVKDFEYTAECIIFDLLRTPLYHGWLVEPDTPEEDVIGSLSYNQLVEKIICDKASDDLDKITAALKAESFLERSSWQMTYHGLCELNSSMKDGELAVFFRNNHFSTIYRRKGQLMYLVTDQGFLNESNIVWAALSSIEGDCVFLDGKFNVYDLEKAAAKEAAAGAALVVNTREQVDADYMLAVSLQKAEQEGDESLDIQKQLGLPPDASDEEIARRLQQEEDDWVQSQQDAYRRSQGGGASSAAGAGAGAGTGGRRHERTDRSMRGSGGRPSGASSSLPATPGSPPRDAVGYRRNDNDRRKSSCSIL